MFEDGRGQDIGNVSVATGTMEPTFWVGYHQLRDGSNPDHPFPEMFDASTTRKGCSCVNGDAAPSGSTSDSTSGKCFSKDYNMRMFANAKKNCEDQNMKLIKFDAQTTFDKVQEFFIYVIATNFNVHLFFFC